MTAFTRTWDAAYEATPADTDEARLLGQFIRNFKSDTQERMEVDHSWAGDVRDGIHVKMEMKAQGSDPTPQNAADGVLYTKLVAGTLELFYKDDTPVVQQLTTGGKLNGVLSLSGGTLTGNIILANAIELQGTEVGATIRDMLVMDSGDLIQLGDAASKLRLKSNDDPVITFGANTFLPFSHGGTRHIKGGGDEIPLLPLEIKTIAGSGAVGLKTITMDFSGRTGATRLLILASFQGQFNSDGNAVEGSIQAHVDGSEVGNQVKFQKMNQALPWTNAITLAYYEDTQVLTGAATALGWRTAETSTGFITTAWQGVIIDFGEV